MEYRTLGAHRRRRVDLCARHHDLRRRDRRGGAATRSSTASSTPAAACRHRRRLHGGGQRGDRRPLARRPALRRHATGSSWPPRRRFPMGTDPNDAGLSRRHLTRRAGRLPDPARVDSVDLYQVHAWDPLTPVEETLGFFDDAVRAGRSATPGCRTSSAGSSQDRRRRRVPRASPGRSPCSRSTTCSSARSSGRSSPPAWRTGSGCCPGRRWAAAGSPASTRASRAPTGATRLGEDPQRGMEAYDSAPPASAPGRRRRRPGGGRGGGAVDGGGRARLGARRPAVSSVILGARTTEQLAVNLAANGLHLTPRRDRHGSTPRAPGAGRLPLRSGGSRTARKGPLTCEDSGTGLWLVACSLP